MYYFIENKDHYMYATEIVKTLIKYSWFINLEFNSKVGWISEFIIISF